MDVMDLNFSLVVQGRIAGCPGDNYNANEILEEYFSVMVHKVWV